MGEKPAIVAGYVAGAFVGSTGSGLVTYVLRPDVGIVGMFVMLGGAVGALVGCYIACRLIRKTAWSDPDYDDRRNPPGPNG
ncbi:MAG TPA: hypothetical protein VM597_10260 [Gemmataceae bacterium]|nr:hypothetical protein [Gemmataceae bacterium]